MIFIFKFIPHFIPQTATSTPFRDPIPAISHLEVIFLTEAKSLRKNTESSTYAVQRKA